MALVIPQNRWALNGELKSVYPKGPRCLAVPWDHWAFTS